MNNSRNLSSDQNTYLITKYGLDNIQTLIDYLESQYVNTTVISQTLDLSRANKIKQQIEYLEKEKQRHFRNQKLLIIQHIMDCIQEEENTILQEFQANRAKDLQELIAQIQDIQQELQIYHMEQLKQIDQEVDLDLCKFMDKKSQHIIQLNKRLEYLCRKQQYRQAQQTKRQLQKQKVENNKKQYYEWKNHKENLVKKIKTKQEKQRNSLRQRLQNLFNQEINIKNSEFQKLVKKLDIQKKRIHNNLLKQQSKYKQELDSLSASRYMKASGNKDSSLSRIRFSRNISYINHKDDSKQEIMEMNDLVFDKNNLPETGPSSKIHTSRRSQTPS